MTTINIAFCFDHNFYRQAGVAIASLLDSSHKQVSFSIYCLCAADVTPYAKNGLAFLVKQKSPASSIQFIRIDDYFADAYEWQGITKASYFRLLLHRLLPEVDRIIYSDVDVLFVGDMSELDSFELNGNLLGAVKSNLNLTRVFQDHKNSFDYFHTYYGDTHDKLFNAGFLIMDLTAIRKANLDSEWLVISKRGFRFMDQDILNITFRDKAAFLPPRYNILINQPLYAELVAEGVFSQEEVDELSNRPVMFHYAGEKPWDNNRCHGGEQWWRYVYSHTPYHDYFRLRHDYLLTEKKLAHANRQIEAFKAAKPNR